MLPCSLIQGPFTSVLQMEGEESRCAAVLKETTRRDLSTDISKGEEYTKFVRYLHNLKPIKSLLL